MRDQEILSRYVDLCRTGLEKEPRVIPFLTRAGAFERFVVDSFQIGYADGTFAALAGEDEEVRKAAVRLGILAGTKERLRSRLTIPILDENRVILNIAGVSLSATGKHAVVALNDSGIFNQAFLRNSEELILTESPLTALALI